MAQVAHALFAWHYLNINKDVFFLCYNELLTDGGCTMSPLSPSFNLLFPEWQGYASSQEVYHGALHLCNHVLEEVEFSEIEVPAEGELLLKNQILGYETSLALFYEASSRLRKRDPDRLFMVGGTCACELAPVSFMNQKYDEGIAVLWFDAHGDLNTPASSPSNRLHGMPLRLLLGEGDEKFVSHINRPLKAFQVALVGARDLDEGERAYVQLHDLPVFSGQKEEGDRIVDFLRDRGYKKVYIHFDLDVLEPNEFPHVLVPTPGGISLDNAIQCLKKIRSNAQIVGASIVEYCPKDGGDKKALHRLMAEGFGYTAAVSPSARQANTSR